MNQKADHADANHGGDRKRDQRFPNSFNEVARHGRASAAAAALAVSAFRR
jgi:hypothetical protein